MEIAYVKNADMWVYDDDLTELGNQMRGGRAMMTAGVKDYLVQKLGVIDIKLAYYKDPWYSRLRQKKMCEYMSLDQFLKADSADQRTSENGTITVDLNTDKLDKKIDQVIHKLDKINEKVQGINAKTVFEACKGEKIEKSDKRRINGGLVDPTIPAFIGEHGNKSGPWSKDPNRVKSVEANIDVNSVEDGKTPIVCVNGRNITDRLTRLKIDWSTDTSVVQPKSFQVEWLGENGQPRGIARSNASWRGAPK